MPETRRTRARARRGLSWRLWPQRTVSRAALTDVGERIAALLLLVMISMAAGVMLGRSIDRFEALPGLLLMVPAAIALRGNIFGALGSRLGTAIHTGTFRLSLRPSTVVGENVLAALFLTLATAVVLAVLAKGAAAVFGVVDSISLTSLVVISVVGGLIASAAALVTALALTAGSVRYGWDPDNITAPLVSGVGDVATIPALVVASMIIGRIEVARFVVVATIVVIAGAVVVVARSARTGLRTILRESSPVLVLGIVMDLIAGVTIEHQLSSFALFPALLVLLPAFLSVAGALGGTLSSRLSSQVHLGLVELSRVPQARARADMIVSLGLAVPIFAVCGLATHAVSLASGVSSPGFGWVVATALLAGLMASVLAAVVAFYSTVASVRLGLDPDTFGIPLVTSTLDLLGAFALILAVAMLGFAS